MKKASWIIFFIFLFAFVGFAREFFSVHINNILYMKYYNRPTQLTVPTSMMLFEHLSYSALYYSKYLYTLIWAAIFFIISYFTLKKFTANRLAIKLLVYIYALLLLAAGMAMLYGYITKQTLQNDEYTLSRWLLGIAQSPIICLILLASEKLYNKSFQS